MVWCGFCDVCVYVRFGWCEVGSGGVLVLCGVV